MLDMEAVGKTLTLLVIGKMCSILRLPFWGIHDEHMCFLGM